MVTYSSTARKRAEEEIKKYKKGLDEIKQTCYYIRVASDETNKENLDNQTAMQP